MRALSAPTFLRCCAAQALLLLVAACGGGGGGGALPATSTAPSALASAVPEASGDCAGGGLRVRIGFDANANGILDSAEVSYTELVCTNGTAATTLTSVVPEPAGAQCAGGGQRVTIGQDTNADGALQPAEALSSAYVCHGAPGAPGAQGPQGPAGADGGSSLLSLSAEPAGGNCPIGGTRVDSGWDTDRDGTLDAGEVTRTAYVCTGATGSGGGAGPAGPTGMASLLLLLPEPAGAACANGGTRVQSGPDSNGNGALDAGEVGGTAFVCNPPPAGLAWASINADTQAAPNTGYMHIGTGEITVTLPQDPAVGSVVRVVAAGGGGWRVGQGASQSIRTVALPVPARWTASWRQLGLPARFWTNVSASADGRYVVAAGVVTSPVASGVVYVSDDHGETWTDRSASAPMGVSWVSTAASRDGRTMAVAGDGPIHISQDSGVSWTARAVPSAWSRVVVSGDGQTMLAAEDTGPVHRSRDGGQAWQQVGGLGVATRRAMAISPDGLRMLVAGTQGATHGIYSSTDGGDSWTFRPTLAVLNAAMSDDGRYVMLNTVAADGATTFYESSSDGGATWASAPAAFMESLSISADGRYRLRATPAGLLASTEYGGPERSVNALPFGALACSIDCARVYAASQTSVYASRLTTSPGPGGGLSGDGGSSVELQYLGAGLWNIIGHAGTVTTR